jgi:hypothetical protein
MMYKQSGFSTLAGVIVVFMIAALVVGGYVITLQRTQPAPVPLATSQTAKLATTDTVQLTKTITLRNTYNGGGVEYTLKYPENWIDVSSVVTAKRGSSVIGGLTPKALEGQTELLTISNTALLEVSADEDIARLQAALGDKLTNGKKLTINGYPAFSMEVAYPNAGTYRGYVVYSGRQQASLAFLVRNRDGSIDTTDASNPHYVQYKAIEKAIVHSIKFTR